MGLSGKRGIPAAALVLASLLTCCPGAVTVQGGSAWEQDGQGGLAEGEFIRTELSPGDLSVGLSNSSLPPGGAGWALLHAGQPRARSGAAMAHDPVAGIIIMFGGNGVPADTWAYNFSANAWEDARPGAGPSARYGHSLTHDARSGLIVLFGGISGSAYSNETWTYNASARAWTRMAPAVSPSPRYSSAMVSDPARGKLLLFGGFERNSVAVNDTWLYDAVANEWTELFPPSSPPPGGMHSMSFDALAGAAVMFGGLGRGDTWEYDPAANEWTETSPAQGPSARSGASLAFDSWLGRSLLFGGFSSGEFLNDLWSYDASGHSWSKRLPSELPPGRNYHCAAFDDRAGALVLFGGVGKMGIAPPFGDTWTFDTQRTEWRARIPTARWGAASAFDLRAGALVLFGGRDDVEPYRDDTWLYFPSCGTWKASTTALRPPARQFASMVYDERLRRCILFGGYYPYRNDTWWYDAANDTWTERSPLFSPPPRMSSALAYHEDEGLCVLFGGNSPSGRLNDTWHYAAWNNTWTRVLTNASPTARSGHSMTLSPLDGRLFLFGGNDSSYQQDTWAYSARDADWTRLTPNGPILPPARMGHSLVFDEARRDVLLVGGRNESGALDDAWAFSAEDPRPAWVAVQAGPRPASRYFASPAYDPGRRACLLFGGLSGATLGDLWAFPASTVFWGCGTFRSTAFDTGGQAHFGRLSWNASVPPGTSVRFRLRTGEDLPALHDLPFVGPDGTAASSYSISGQEVFPGHDGSRHVQYEAELATELALATPTVGSVRITYNLMHSVSLLWPAGGELWVGRGEVLWEAGDPDGGNLTFDLRLSTDSGRSYPVLLASGLTGTAFAWDGAEARGLDTCRIKVVARDEDPEIPLEAESASGSDFRVARANAPPEAELLAPPPGSTVRTAEVALSWNGTDPDGDPLGYHVLIDGTEVAFSLDTTHAARSLSAGPHCWTVIPDDGIENGTCLSGNWSFLLAPNELPAATLLAPPPGTVVRTGSVELKWRGEDPENDALTYAVMVNNARVATTNATSFNLTGLLNGPRSWHVLPFDGFGEGTCLPGPWEFEVMLNRGPLVTLLAPAPGSVLNSTRVRLSWKGTDIDLDALSYTIAVTGDRGFELTENSTGTELELELPNRANYTWWVSASDGFVLSTSPGSNFTVWLNRAPGILSLPPLSARHGSTYAYRVVVADPDGDILSFTLIERPRGMVISADGNITWRPSPDQQGRSFPVRLSVSDGDLEDVQAFVVRVLSSGGTGVESGPVAGAVLLLLAVLLAGLAVRDRSRKKKSAGKRR